MYLLLKMCKDFEHFLVYSLYTNDDRCVTRECSPVTLYLCAYVCVCFFILSLIPWPQEIEKNHPPTVTAWLYWTIVLCACFEMLEHSATIQN